MSDYELTWITEYIAVGHAPMSYDDLDCIKEQGISGIVNLCGEYSDLHEIEENAGFEVFYIPIPDETAPTIPEMEKGLAWLDESVYLGKKVLVHCKHGVGRTGTFVTAYMLRRGFNLKKAGKLLKKNKTRANPTNYSQWWLLRKFGKKEGQLKIFEPSATNRSSKTLENYYKRYEKLLAKVDTLAKKGSCKVKKSSCCKRIFNLSLIEALYLNNKVNITLSSSQRNKVIREATGISETTLQEFFERENSSPSTEKQHTLCPLYQEDQCLLHKFRPIQCRIADCEFETRDLFPIYEELALLSEEVFYAVFGKESTNYISLPEVNNRDTISGKFIQRYFQHLTIQKTKKKEI